MIWKRYFYKEIVRTFCFLLFSFFALFVVIDLLAHLKEIRAGSTTFSVWTTYYLCTFSKRLDVLLPFAVLIGTIRILLALQARNELVALLVSGLPLRTLLMPFILSACVASAILYVNFEYILPKAQPRAQFIQENDFGKSKFTPQELPIKEVLLKDASRIFYRNYNPNTQQFEDLFWLNSIDKVYHIQTLDSSVTPPIGYHVDLLERDATGKMLRTASSPKLILDNMLFDQESLNNSYQPPKDQSLTTLVSQMRLYGSSTADRAIDIQSYFIYKISFPLLCLIAALLPAPFCLTFRRHMPHFMIYLVALGGMFCFFLLLQVALVLAKSHVASPLAAISIPWLVAFAVVGKKYMRVLHGTA